MSTKILEIQPSELKFTFELKKQSSCSVRLTNNTNRYVAFKVKTTSPKKYCVRPNVGIIMPKSNCDFTVTMQAQRLAPPDMVCKDKFLIQSTVVPLAMTEEDITPSIFSKDSGTYIEECKLRVSLISPPHSPVLSPIDGTFKQGLAHEASILKEPVLSRAGIVTLQHTVAKDVESKMVYGEDVESKIVYGEDLKPAKFAELKPKKDAVNDEELKPAKDSINDMELKPTNYPVLKPAKDAVNEKELKPAKDAVNEKELKPAKDAQSNPKVDEELKTVRAVEELKLVKDIEEMKSKLNELESKLNEAEGTISTLTEERRSSIRERKILQEEVAVLRSKMIVKRIQVGFPLLFVCMVALISIMLGYLSHP